MFSGQTSQTRKNAFRILGRARRPPEDYGKRRGDGPASPETDEQSRGPFERRLEKEKKKKRIHTIYLSPLNN